MRITFTLSDDCAELMRRTARTLALNTGKTLTEHEIARALILEVITDDMAANGELELIETRH